MLEIRGAAPGLLDDPLLLEVGGAPPNSRLTWRARLLDDDGFVWRAAADTSAGLLTAWAPAKPSAGAVMALRSLRPVDVDVRVEAPDGAAASRTITRTLVADGVKVRRWREGVVGSLYLPSGDAARALVVDARAQNDAVTVAAALLASRGVLVFVVSGGKGGGAVEEARELVAALPSAPAAVDPVEALPLPPGAAGNPDPTAWDAVLAELGAMPRRVAR
jgi:hypothetical protein